MSTMLGKKFRVYLESSDGKLLELDALTASISRSSDMVDITCYGEPDKTCISGAVRTEINLVGVGDITWTDSSEFIRKKRSVSEWKCEWCGHINPIASRYCGHNDKHAVGCGAHRSFLLND